MTESEQIHVEWNRLDPRLREDDIAWET